MEVTYDRWDFRVITVGCWWCHGTERKEIEVLNGMGNDGIGTTPVEAESQQLDQTSGS